MVGSEARRHFVGGFATDWADNPFVLGAYGAVKPGAYGARAELAKPLDDRLFFAGEASAGATSAYVHVAYQSGEAVARDIVRVLS